MLLMLASNLPHLLFIPTMRPLLMILGCPVVCLLLCAATDGLIAGVERLGSRRHRHDRVIELKRELKPANAERRLRAGMRTV